MAVYLIAFTLQTPGANPAPIVEGIKKIGDGGWMYYIPNMVFIHSKETANQLAEKAYKLITQGDYLIVIRVTNEHQGWLPPDAWNWLNTSQY